MHILTEFDAYTGLEWTAACGVLASLPGLVCFASRALPSPHSIGFPDSGNLPNRWTESLWWLLLDRLLPQNPTRSHEPGPCLSRAFASDECGTEDSQSSMPAPQAAHALGLHARHAQEVFGVGQVCRELGELGVQLGELSRLDGTSRRGHGLARHATALCVGGEVAGFHDVSAAEHRYHFLRFVGSA